MHLQAHIKKPRQVELQKDLQGLEEQNAEMSIPTVNLSAGLRGCLRYIFAPLLIIFVMLPKVFNVLVVKPCGYPILSPHMVGG